jgi:hypothetical protein
VVLTDIRRALIVLGKRARTNALAPGSARLMAAPGRADSGASPSPKPRQLGAVSTLAIKTPKNALVLCRKRCRNPTAPRAAPKTPTVKYAGQTGLSSV